MHETEAAYRDGKAKRVDQELGLLLAFPGFIRRILMRLVDVADRLGMLPASYIENDPMYASAFFANMASLGMPAVFHHLYEYGTVGNLRIARPSDVGAGQPDQRPRTGAAR